MLKLLQITDCHLVPPGGTLFGSDPNARLAAAFADINRNHPDAALCVLTGDIAHDGDRPSYAVLRDLLDPIRELEKKMNVGCSFFSLSRSLS